MPALYFLIPVGNNPHTGSGGPALLKSQVHEELQRIVANSLFAKSPRMCELLRFLVLQMLEGSAARTNEYAIGIEVFGRNGAHYSTGEDPIVRVQVGRLRRKLATYYAVESRGNALRIDIPLGSYLPRVVLAEGNDAQGAALTFQPLCCLSQDTLAQSFTLGLNDELGYRLHREFGTAGVNQLPRRPISYVLEGSVRQDGARARTSLRLVDRIRGGIAWCEQLDHDFDLPLVRQEQMADACCRVVRQHLGMA